MGGFSCRIFNAGNTHVQIAELAGDSLRLIETVPTAEFRVEDFAVETMAAASVVPDLEERFRKAGAFIVSSRMANCPVDLSRMEHAETLGADRLQTMGLLLYELRFGLTTAVVSGFSRGISEVGAVMIVGGNIDGKTRTMTTYLSQLKGMGEFERAVAVGLILLVISFAVNTLLYNFQKETGRR